MSNELRSSQEPVKLTNRGKRALAGVVLAAVGVGGYVAHETDHVEPTITYTVQSPDTNPTQLAKDLGAVNVTDEAQLISNKVGGPTNMNYGDKFTVNRDDLRLPGVDPSALHDGNTQLTRDAEGHITPVENNQ